MNEKRDRPTDDCLVLAALLTGREWIAADELRGCLERLGFVASTQQVAAWLGRLVHEDSPMFERRKLWEFPEYHYSVTRFGRTQVSNSPTRSKSSEPPPLTAP